MMKLLLCILPILVLSDSIKWEDLVRVSGNESGKRCSVSHHCAATGVTHVFWEEIDPKEDWYLYYRAISPEGTLSSTVKIGERPLPFAENRISVQSTDDGKHILLAYGGYRYISNKGCTTKNDASCIEIYFTETLNGGISWNSPVKINRTKDYDDTVHRTTPSLVLEKDTGRVYIGYFHDRCNALAIREPGNELFNLELRIPCSFAYTLDIGVTVPKNNLTRYLHWIYHEDTINKTKEISYQRSEDKGLNWSKRKILAYRYKSGVVPVAVINNEAAEGGVFIQSAEDGLYYIMWSKDHGMTWEPNITIAQKLTNYHALAICGRNNEGRVFTFSLGQAMVRGHAKYFETGSTEVKAVRNPFGTINSIRTFEAHCAVSEGGEYTVVATLSSPSLKEILVARGKTVKDVNSLTS